MHNEWPQQLSTGLVEMEIALTDGQQQKMLTWLVLLQKWNRAFNLTAIRDPQEMVGRQLLDSLSILRIIEGPRILDVGTGPGLPVYRYTGYLTHTTHIKNDRKSTKRNSQRTRTNFARNNT